MTKEQLRETYLQKRILLSEKSCSIMSHEIQEKFISHFDLSSLNTIHSFIPLTKNKEPDTWIIIDWIRMKFPNVRISLPKVNFRTQQIKSLYFDDRFPLKKNKWGIEEPTKGETTLPGNIDLVIVPLVAIDVKGNRVGYGKGYYDMFLAQCRPDCTRVGLSFFEPVDRVDDLNAFDIPLHHCVTPKKIYSF